MGTCFNGPMDLFPLNQLGVMKDVNREQLYICHPVISAHKHVTWTCHLVNERVHSSTQNFLEMFIQA